MITILLVVILMVDNVIQQILNLIMKLYKKNVIQCNNIQEENIHLEDLVIQIFNQFQKIILLQHLIIKTLFKQQQAHNYLNKKLIMQIQINNNNKQLYKNKPLISKLINKLLINKKVAIKTMNHQVLLALLLV